MTGLRLAPIDRGYCEHRSMAAVAFSSSYGGHQQRVHAADLNGPVSSSRDDEEGYHRQRRPSPSYEPRERDSGWQRRDHERRQTPERELGGYNGGGGGSNYQGNGARRGNWGNTNGRGGDFFAE